MLCAFISQLVKKCSAQFIPIRVFCRRGEAAYTRSGAVLIERNDAMVYVCDAIMGAGKSSAAMWHINNTPGRYVYMTPYLSEVNRVVRNCAARDFKQPRGNRDGSGGKTRDFYRLLLAGENIASTHAMFGRLDPETLSAIRHYDYDLVLDEVFNVLNEVTETQTDIEDAVKLGYIEVEDGWLKWVDGDYRGHAFANLRSQIHRMKVMQAANGDAMAVLFPPEIFDAFRDVYILTYMFDASLMKCYFDMCGIAYRKVWPKKVGDHYELTFEEQPPPDYCRYLFTHIHLIEEDKLNEVGKKRGSLSVSWYAREGAHGDGVDKLRRNLRTFRRRCDGKGRDSVMWCCFKDYYNYVSDRSTKTGFVPVGIRATNAYSSRTNVAYLVNVFLNPFLKNAIVSNGAEPDEDGYALSEMIQWIWRSGIRNGKDINLYIPSARMRGMFKHWLYGLARK